MKRERASDLVNVINFTRTSLRAVNVAGVRTRCAPNKDWQTGRPEWHQDAECANWLSDDPRIDIFYPKVGQTGDVAKFICSVCPVKDACLADALLEERGLHRVHRHGVRAGTSPGQRYQMALSAGEKIRDAA